MWKKSDIPESAKKLMAEGYSELASLVMSKAGIDSKEKAEEFLYSETIHNPAKIRNIEKVAEIIWNHIYSDKKICIFGDYDADGVSGAAMCVLDFRIESLKVMEYLCMQYRKK